MTDFYCCLYILPDIVLVDYDNFKIRKEFYDKKNSPCSDVTEVAEPVGASVGGSVGGGGQSEVPDTVNLSLLKLLYLDMTVQSRGCFCFFILGL